MTETPDEPDVQDPNEPPSKPEAPDLPDPAFPEVLPGGDDARDHSAEPNSGDSDD